MTVENPWLCQFCGDIAFKTNGKSELICESRAYTGQCKKDKEQLKSDKPSRNQPCPCGSGKKYKRCCGKAVIPDFKHTPPAPSPLCSNVLPSVDFKCEDYKHINVIKEFEIIETAMLTGMTIAIKQGNKLYVWPDFEIPTELKYIEVATQEEWESEMFKQRLESYESGNQGLSRSESLSLRHSR